MSDLSVEFKISPRVPANSAGVQVETTQPDSATELCADSDNSSDVALMKRLSQGDEAAMNLLLTNHGNMLARLVGRLMAWSADHEDVLQEVLLHIWNKAGSYRGSGPLGGWLRRLAINKCHNHFRKQNSIRQKFLTLLDAKRYLSSTLANQKQATDPATQVQDALSKLNSSERMVLVLFYLEEMTGEEVASQLGIKIESLHVRLHRARKKLKLILTSEVSS